MDEETPNWIAVFVGAFMFVEVIRFSNVVADKITWDGIIQACVAVSIAFFAWYESGSREKQSEIAKRMLVDSLLLTLFMQMQVWPRRYAGSSLDDQGDEFPSQTEVSIFVELMKNARSVPLPIFAALSTAFASRLEHDVTDACTKIWCYLEPKGLLVNKGSLPLHDAKENIPDDWKDAII